VKKGGKVKKIFLTFIILQMLIFCVFIGPISSQTNIIVKGFDEGPSYTSVIPIKKTTFVDFDENSYLDDYAYLASIPTAVFTENDKIYSHPLLYFQEPMDSDDDITYLPLNARRGIDYFMEDWMDYCNGRLDKITLVNVQKEELNESWKTMETEIISGKDPYEIAGLLALSEWSYSDEAVIAIIEEEFKTPTLQIKNETKGVLPISRVKNLEEFNLNQKNSLNPVFKTFNVDEKYKYIKAETWWDGFIFMNGIIIPTGDPDIQLYCPTDEGWMQTAAASNWNIFYPIGKEFTQSHVYNFGTWRVGITDFPTESEAPQQSYLGGLINVQGTFINAILSTILQKVTYHVDIKLYPGVDVILPDKPPFGCRSADFKLQWDNEDVDLGFTIIGPAGEAIYTMINESSKDEINVHLDFLGECLENEVYSVSVFALNDIDKAVDFTLKYTWNQTISQKEGNALSSATEGAVIASLLNSPLLFSSPSSFSLKTKEALLKLGVENVYIIDLEKNLEEKVKNEILSCSKIKEQYVFLSDIYDFTQNKIKSQDIVFSTYDPWTYWELTDSDPSGPVDDQKGSLFIGPAAYAAAHHGTPVILLDNHPRLSSAVVWHNEFWKRFSSDRFEYVPSTAEMVLTGKRIYDFLEHFGFDSEGEEQILTVADQYDIGISWDRIFPGVANSGRICGSPVDTAYWISRNIFYPALIFENPAVQGKTSMINGSISSREGLLGLLKKPLFNTLVINRETREEMVNYPVLCSFVTHKYRFNERASKYYGTKYQCADGLTPGFDATMEPIDQGSIAKHGGEPGSYFPDMLETEIIPFYLNKGGFGTVYSTNLDYVANNLNRGVILWIHASHGTQGKGGVGSTLFWDPNEGFDRHARFLKPLAGAVREENPWRGYDWYLGSTREPDTMSMDIHGIIPFSNHEPIIWPATGRDWVLARKPVRESLNKILDLFNLIRFRFNTENLYDGLTGTIDYSKYPLWWKNGLIIEEHFSNLHSTGFITSICQTSNTYLHLMIIRHGSVFQVQDPWPTSWYGAVWRQSIPRDIILGDTVCEAYVKGMKHVGTLYITDEPQWWWDTAENLVYFGDPGLRMYVPLTTYSSANFWEKDDTESLRYKEKISIGGHMPFGATSYPNEKQAMTIFNQYLLAIIALVIILFLIILIRIINRSKADVD
jgi:hypothetical protein